MLREPLTPRQRGVNGSPLVDRLSPLVHVAGGPCGLRSLAIARCSLRFSGVAQDRLPSGLGFVQPTDGRMMRCIV